MGDGLQRCSLSIATRPQPSQTNFIAVNLLLHMWAWLMSGSPQNEHFCRSPQGSQRWPGSLATAPHRLQVWAIFSLLILKTTSWFFLCPPPAYRHRRLILKRGNGHSGRCQLIRERRPLGSGGGLFHTEAGIDYSRPFRYDKWLIKTMQDIDFRFAVCVAVTVGLAALPRYEKQGGKEYP
jgi:hypothetical protein